MQNLSDILFLVSLVSLIIWAASLKGANFFRINHTNINYRDEGREMQEALMQEHKKKLQFNFKVFYGSFFFVFGFLGMVISIVISYLK
ncbi:hypothetical protein [Paenibacillus sp. FJAT-26967]|uniref:hypothetical protein n=1 Tax=Paenibacillus sp. FJAT-26967 TaxID=1729690 RepID=UPI00083973EE|nr:hypothetical protein [Paenibacillus sp. FJAT-26967]